MMNNIMKKYFDNKIKPSIPFYKFLIVDDNRYQKEIIDILTDAIGESEIINYDGYSVIFYFNAIDIDFKSLIKTINDDFYSDAHLFESGKVVFNDGTEFKQIVDVYHLANLNKYTYTSNKHILSYLINNDKEQAKKLAPILLNKMLKDESLLMLASTMFECDLNVSLTAKNTYMHRNTVIYKLEQIENETGLDIRRFKDAIIMYEFLKIV